VTSDLGDWFTDDADANEARSLGRSAFVDVVVRGVDACKNRKSSTVLSLVGAWGSGKSSIIEAVTEELRAEDDNWKILRFNPWIFQDLPSLQSGFFAELREAFPGEMKGTKAREKIADLAEAVSPFASAASLVGFDGSAVVQGAAKLVGGDRSVTAAQHRLEKILEKRARPILVVMDDLDRLAPDELLLTLKLVRLIGRLPYVHYLLAYDEDTLLDALTRTGLVGASKSRARDYLEKVVQVRFDVPAIRPNDIAAMTTTFLNKALSDVKMDMDNEQLGRFTRAYFAHLQRRLDTPRAIRRYWAQVRLSIAELSGELDVADFLIITWLRTAEPGAYRLIQERRADILGGSGRGRNLSAKDLESSQTDLKEGIAASGARPGHVEGVAEVLGQILPNFRAIWEGKARVNIDGASQRVSNPDYFDRYFSLGVPDGDIRDSTVKAAMDQIAAGAAGPEERLLVATLISSPQLALAKIGPLSRTARPGPIFIWLADHYYDIPPETTLFTVREQALGIAISVLREVAPLDLEPTIIAAIRTVSGLPLTVQAIAAAARRSDEDPPSERPITLDAATRTTIGGMFENAYASLAIVDPFEMEPDLWVSIWSWSAFDLPSLKRWIADRHLVWGSLDLLARFVSTSRLIGGPNESRLGVLDFSLLEDLVDVDAIQLELAVDLDKAELPQAVSALPESPENRRITALAYLRARRSKIVSSPLPG
jgi:hypothetical protein